MSSSSKTSQPSEPEGSTASSQTLTASGLMRRGRLSRREPPDSTCDVPGSSCWPSPTVEDARASRRHGYTIAGHSGTTLTDAMLLWYGIEASEEPPMVLNPDFCEALLALPQGWTNVDDESACAALGMQSRQLKLF